MQDTQSNEKPLVSFIITHYNIPAQMLRECIESIESIPMRHDEKEIILIDDGSEESPLRHIGDLADRITYIRHDNCGLSVSRNRGAEACNGHYIQFVDADDCLISQNYWHIVKLLKADKSLDLIMFNLSEHKRLTEEPLRHTTCCGTEYMLRNNIKASACGYVFRKDILGDIRFTPGILHEDEEFTPQLLLKAERMAACDINAYFYRKRDESITHRQSAWHTAKRLNDTERIIYSLRRKADSMHSDKRKALTRRADQLAMDYIYNIIVGTRSGEELEERTARLRKMGAMPQAHKWYTSKYMLFCLLANCKTGRGILLKVLPFIIHRQ